MSSLSNTEVASEILPYIQVYKDGLVKRLAQSPYVPPSVEDPETGVSSKDIRISKNPPISARIYLPKQIEQHQKVPVLVYYHGGGFCFESAFSFTETKYMNSLAYHAKVVIISIEYRLAPEHPLPIAYEDCWAGLQWVVSHSGDSVADDDDSKEPWLSTFVDFDRVYVAGDSAGANLAHNILIRAGSVALKGGVKIKGAFLTHPYFWGAEPVGSEIQLMKEREKHPAHTMWQLVYPEAPGGVDNPMLNPLTPTAPSLAGLGCSRLLVTVASNDLLRDRGILYYNAVKHSGWKGELKLIQVDGEDHAFHVLVYDSDNAIKLIKSLASFLV